MTALAVAQPARRSNCEPLWRSFYGSMPTHAHPHTYVDKATVGVAFHVSGMFDRIVGVDAPLATMRDLSRFLLLLRSLRAVVHQDDDAPAQTPTTTDGDGVPATAEGTAAPTSTSSSSLVSRIRPEMMDLPSPSFSGMLLPALRRHAAIAQYVAHTYAMLCGGGGGGHPLVGAVAAGGQGVRLPAFRAFLTSVLVAVCANAFRVPPPPTPGALNMSPRGTHVDHHVATRPDQAPVFFVPTDAEIIDAVVLGEWRHQRTGSVKCLGLAEYTTWLLNTAMLLTTCGNHGSKATQNVVELFEAVLVPLAEKLHFQTTSVHGEGSGGALVDPDVEMATASATAAKPLSGVRGTLSPRTAQAGTVATVGRHSKRRMLPELRTKGPAPDLNGTHKGLNDPDSIESMQSILGHSKDVSSELEAKLLHSGALRLMDGYPMKLRR